MRTATPGYIGRERMKEEDIAEDIPDDRGTELWLML